MITIYSFTYNEELMLPFFIKHYRSRFHNCRIVLYDNSSTDNTVEIAETNGCEVRHYESGNSMNDYVHMVIKNSCWKDSNTDWVLVCDLDELLDIDEKKLIAEELQCNTIINTEGWSLVNLNDNQDLESMNHGFRDSMYDKKILFNKKFISEINYDAGSHNCSPIGNVKYSNIIYKLYHYKYINPDLFVSRSLLTGKRLSPLNMKNNWGYQNLRSESELRNSFELLRKSSVKLFDCKDKMNITIYTVTFNEELIMQFFIDHYRDRFPGCHIVVYDNDSTDNTVEIAKRNGCEIRPYSSNGRTNDKLHLDTKNNCWRDAKTDWVLVCDTDELLDINENDLEKEETKGTTRIKSECWHMINMNNNYDLKNIVHGYRGNLVIDGSHVYSETVYDKDILFNKKYVDINYICTGCHHNSSRGKVIDSKPYKLWHYKYINPDLFLSKRQSNRSRLPQDHIEKNWGTDCLMPDDWQKKEFETVRTLAKKVRGLIPHFHHEIQGWFNFESIYSDIVNKLPNNSHIVEVGSWKGRSTAYLAVEIINSGKSIKLDAVDSWTGDEGDPLSFNEDPEFMAYNRNIFELFRKNLSPVFGKIDLTPIQMIKV
jgi:glycosyltransferase involved in cell wall biosynthesis